MSSIPEIDVATLETRIADGGSVVDVREDDEYADGHIPGARLVPLSSVPERVSEFPIDATVHVVCAMGGRSARAVEFLRAQGIDAVNVVGGTQGWIDSGRSVVRGMDPS